MQQTEKLQRKIRLHKVKFPERIGEIEGSLKEQNSRISNLEKVLGIGNTTYLLSSDQEAEKEISTFLAKKKSEGAKTLNIIDLMNGTKLPPIQIERVMKNLAEKGVTEIDS